MPHDRSPGKSASNSAVDEVMAPTRRPQQLLDTCGWSRAQQKSY
jgi:hypothetical protein